MGLSPFSLIHLLSPPALSPGCFCPCGLCKIIFADVCIYVWCVRMGVSTCVSVVEGIYPYRYGGLSRMSVLALVGLGFPISVLCTGIAGRSCPAFPWVLGISRPVLLFAKQFVTC